MSVDRHGTAHHDNGSSYALVKQFDAAIERLSSANAVAAVSPVFEVIDTARPLMFDTRGLEALYTRVPAIEAAGFFGGRDWDYPQTLVPSLAVRTVRHGIAVTDSATRFLGWHAITIQRLALDPSQVMRVYFFNPNNDSGQDWGQGIVTSTLGNGELYGEASLPVAQFASRLYVFHYDPLKKGEPADIPTDDVDRAKGLAQDSWASGC